MAIIKNLIGIDIGSSSVKLVKLKAIKDKIELEKARIVELKDAKFLSQAVTTLLGNEKITSKMVFFHTLEYRITTYIYR